jgi:uncharacterized protein YceH (UPF0502 family)
VPDITDDAPTLDDVIRLYVIGVCVACNWNLTRASKVLNVAVKSVYNYLHKYQDQGYLCKWIGSRVRSERCGS